MNPAALLLAALLADLGAAPPAVARVHDLARLTPAGAERLQGRVALYRVALDSTAGEHDGFVLYDAVSPPWADASVWLYPGQDVEDEMTVEAELRIVRHEGRGPFPGFTEYRVTRAVVRRGW